MELNKKQASFCREYVIDYNGTQACIRAGYTASCANVTASKLLTKTNIKAYIAELEAEKHKQNKSWIEQLILMREDAIPVYRALLQSPNDNIRKGVCESLFQLDKIDLSDDKPEQDNF